MICLSTARLSAVPVTADDAPVFERLWGDERVARTLGGLRDAATVRRLLAESVQHGDEHGFGRWVVRRGQEPVGSVKLARVDVTGRPEVELGYALLPEHWGKGYAIEAARGALAVAADLGLGTVIAYALTTNLASLAVMERLGFVHEQFVELPGGAHDVRRLELAHVR